MIGLGMLLVGLLLGYGIAQYSLKWPRKQREPAVPWVWFKDGALWTTPKGLERVEPYRFFVTYQDGKVYGRVSLDSNWELIGRIPPHPEYWKHGQEGTVPISYLKGEVKQ